MKPLILVAACCIVAAARADDLSAQAKKAQLEAERAAAGKLESRACPAEQQVVRTVDLDRPGAFSALKDSNRAHFIRLFSLQESKPRALHETWTWMHTQAKACDMTMLNFYRTSFPAQALLSFVLDDTRYTRTVYVGQGR